MVPRVEVSRCRRSLSGAVFVLLASCGTELGDAPTWSRELPGRIVAVADGAVPEAMLESLERVAARLGVQRHDTAGGRSTWIAPSVEVGYASLADSSAFREAWQRRGATATASRGDGQTWLYIDLQILVDALRAALQREAPRALGLIDALGLTNLRFAAGDVEARGGDTTIAIDVVSAAPDARPAAFFALADRRPSLLPTSAVDHRAAAEVRFEPAEAASAIGAFSAALQGDDPMGFLAMASAPVIASVKRAIAASDGRVSLRFAADGATAIAIGARDPIDLRDALSFVRRRPADEAGGAAELPFQFAFLERADHLLLWRGREPSGGDLAALDAAAAVHVRSDGRELDLRIERRPSAELRIRAVLR
jgi:hypothetical protein